MSQEEIPFDFEGMVSVKSLGASLLRQGAHFEYATSDYRKASATKAAMTAGYFTPQESDKAAKHQDEEAANIEGLKATIINDLQNQYNNTSDPSEKARLTALITRVQSSQGREALVAIADAQAALSASGATSSIDASGGASRGEINAMHHELYNTDPEYRHATDEISKEADARMGVADKRADTLKTLAEQNGIHTDFDAAVEDTEKKAKAARDNGDALEARRLEAELLKLRAEQNKAREAEAKRLGLAPEVTTQFHNGAASDQDDFAKAMEALKKQQQAYLEARERRMEIDYPNDPEAIKNALAPTRKSFTDDIEALNKDHNALAAEKLAKDYHDKVQELAELGKPLAQAAAEVTTPANHQTPPAAPNFAAPQVAIKTDVAVALASSPAAPPSSDPVAPLASPPPAKMEVASATHDDLGSAPPALGDMLQATSNKRGV